ncbi:MAG: hypothetical protein BAA01_15260 [Bacillus thermozeamaize]|uniref:Carboxymuconolactone decarboxylase-like domain-containing protein n=1 Tax=Bacillus thermozeamaize TaxID=230954 RepID=A0A1Y3PF06_9BACI|nr:MAG: hypothetical protein BAA01_15260 [Bacillus thermozeamaize]
MSRISLVDIGAAADDVKQAAADHEQKYGRITNMKRTLLHAVPAFQAYMEWYTLRDQIEPFIGKRGVYVFSHAISTQNECLICSTFFRRLLIESVEDPDRLELDEKEQVLVDFGRQLAKDANQVSDELFSRLQAFFDERQIVLLTAFAGLMIATNLFNNALRIPLDDYLENYRAK